MDEIGENLSKDLTENSVHGRYSVSTSLVDASTDDRKMTETEEDINASADYRVPAQPVHMEEEELNDTQSNDDENDSKKPLNPELQQGYRILKELMADSNKSVNWHFLEAVDATHPETTDYYERIKRPVWLSKMLSKFEDREYETITEFVSDFRLMLENCYRYNGPDHFVSKRGQKLETMMEQKLALLSRELREKTSIAATSGQHGDDQISLSGLRRRTRTIIPHDSSVLLNQLREEELRREREARKQQISERKAVQEAQLQELLDWENNLMDNKGNYMRAMWELPQIGHFLFLCQDVLNIGEIPQFELERCFYMPRESAVMQKVMTALLSTPFQRQKIDKKTLMPYKIWDEKLRIKLRQWYKTYVDGHEDEQRAAVKLGIDINFFSIVGSRNPMERRKFHELCPYRRVWIVKSLCEYCLEHQESIREAIESQPIEEQHDYLLGVDANGMRYLHFPQFCGADLRIYKQEKIPDPKFTTPVVETPKLKAKETDIKMDVEKPPSSKKKKKKKKIKLDIPAPPTNRPSRLRQTIKTVIPVQNLSMSLSSSSSSSSSSPSSDEDENESDESDSNTRTSFEEQSDLNLNDSGICDETPTRKRKTRPLNKKISQLMESDNCSDTSSVDGEGACKRSRTRRLVRNGLFRDMNIFEQSLDESSMDRDDLSELKDETMSETSFKLDTDSNMEETKIACNHSDIKSGSESKSTPNRGERDMDDSDSDSQSLNQRKLQKDQVGGSGSDQLDAGDSEFQNSVDIDEKGDNSIKVTSPQFSPCDSLSTENTCQDVATSDIGDSTSQSGIVPPINDRLLSSPLVQTIEDDKKPAHLTHQPQTLSTENSADTATPCTNTPTKRENLETSSNCMTDTDKETGNSMPVMSVLDIKTECSESVTQNKENLHSTPCENENSISSCDIKDTPKVKVKIENEHELEESSGTILDHDYSGTRDTSKKLDHDYGQGCCADIENMDKKDNAEGSELEKEEEVLPALGPFELIVESVEDLRALVESFAEQEPIVIGKGKKQKVIKPPPRKRCVTDLHGRLLYLLKELEPWEQKLVQATRKARSKMQKEHMNYVEEQVEDKWDSEHSESSECEDGENTDQEASEDDEEKTGVPASTVKIQEDSSINQIDKVDDDDEIDISLRGRIRKRRVIPNNSEDTGTPKKRKLVNVSIPSTVSHVPNILQRTGKMVSGIPGITGPQGSSTASQILLQTSSGNLALHTGLSSLSNVRLVSGDMVLQSQATSLLNKPTQQQQPIAQGLSQAKLLQGLSQNAMTSKQASHPVIQQLLSTTRHPATGTLQSTQQRMTFQSTNKQTQPRPQNLKPVTQGMSLVNTHMVTGKDGPSAPNLPNMPSGGGKIQYYAANINTLPPSVLQQLIKSNALKIPPGPNQSGMVLLTTVNPQGQVSSCRNQQLSGLQVQSSAKTPVRTATGPSSVLPPQKGVSLPTPGTAQTGLRFQSGPESGSAVQKNTTQVTNKVDDIRRSVSCTSTSQAPVQNSVKISAGASASQNQSSIMMSNLPKQVIPNQGSVELVTTGSKSLVMVTSSSLSPINTISTSPNRQTFKYANNVTVKTLLEARKDAEKVPVDINKKSEMDTSSTTVVLQAAVPGIKTLKIPSKAALDSAVQAVVTEVKTSLPTANIKVPAPVAMPTIQPRHNVTKTIQSMKGPIPTAPKVEPMSSGSLCTVNTTVTQGLTSVPLFTSSVQGQTALSPFTSQVQGQTTILASVAQGQTVNANQSLLSQLQLGNNQIMLTTLNKAGGIGNVVLASGQQQQVQDKKNMTLKVLPQGLQQPQQGVMQGYLTPQGLIIPQAALQQTNTQLITQQTLNNLPLQLGIGAAKVSSVSPVIAKNQMTASQTGTSVFISGQNKVVSTVVQGTTERPPLKENRTGVSVTNTVSSLINATPTLSTSVVSSANAKLPVNVEKLPVSSGDVQKSQVKMQAIGGPSSLLNLSGVSKLQGQNQGLLMPGMNLVHVGGQLKLQEGGTNQAVLGKASLGLSTVVSSSSVSTAVTKTSTVSPANTLGLVYPIVTLGGPTMTNITTGSSASHILAPSSNPVPQSPVQLTAPVLGQLTNPVANMGNIATVLGQLASPLAKTGIIGQQTGLGGNLQLLGQPGVKVGGTGGQIIRLPNNQQINIPATTVSVIGQQLPMSVGGSQILGQQLTSPLSKQAPLMLGNIGQGSSSDLIKQLAAAQLQLTGQSSSAVSQGSVPNQMVLQVPASPGVKEQSVVRPSGQQNLKGNQTMLLLSPQKRLQAANIGSGTQQPKQLTLRLNSPVLQTQQIKLPIVSSGKVPVTSGQDSQKSTQVSKVKLNFDIQSTKAATQTITMANQLSALQSTSTGSQLHGTRVTVSSVQPVGKTPIASNQIPQVIGAVKTNTTCVLTANHSSMGRSKTATPQVQLPAPLQQAVIASVPDTGNTTVPGPAPSPPKPVSSQAGGSQKLFLYNIGGQLVTPQGVPVTVDNGVLKVLLPQSKITTPASALAGQKLAMSANPPVTVASNNVSRTFLIPPKILDSQQVVLSSQNTNIAGSNILNNVTSTPGNLKQRNQMSAKVNDASGTTPQSTVNISSSVVKVSKSKINSSGTLSHNVTLTTMSSSVPNMAPSTMDIKTSVAEFINSGPSIKIPDVASQSILSPVVKMQTNPDHAGLVNQGTLLTSSQLQINQLLAQQTTTQAVGSAVSSIAALPNNKDYSLPHSQKIQLQSDTKQQIGLQVTPNIGHLIGSGQGFIVMPGTTKQTQIIFPQQGQQSSSGENMKMMKTQNMSELLKNQVVLQGQNPSLLTSVTNSKHSLVQNNSQSLVKDEMLNNNSLESVAQSGLKNKQHSVEILQSGSAVVPKPLEKDVNHRLSDSDVTTNGVDNIDAKNGMLINSAPSLDNSDAGHEEGGPKGADQKEEAALNLLSLANLAFNR